MTAGLSITQAKAAMILVHGRGASASDILELADVLGHPDFAYLAPQARGNTWYPNSFLSPMRRNEPGLSSALQVLADLVAQLENGGIPAHKIVLAGFSQGACLASEFVARHARRYGGLLVFSGGLIGPEGTPRNYAGDLAGTPVFLGCSDVDFHIPKGRVHETTAMLKKLGGNVTEKIYPNMGHTIVHDEVHQARRVLDWDE